MTLDFLKRKEAQRFIGIRKPKGEDETIEKIVGYLQRVSGSVLEIGVGSGNLLPYLPKQIQYYGIEPNPHLLPLAQSESAAAGFVSATVIDCTAEKLAFNDSFFDTVISVRTLCGTKQPEALAGIVRVLKPGGVFIFAEHVRDPRLTLRFVLQKILSMLRRVLHYNCDLSQDTARAIAAAGFAHYEIYPFEVKRYLGRYRIFGKAVKG